MGAGVMVWCRGLGLERAGIPTFTGILRVGVVVVPGDRRCPNCPWKLVGVVLGVRIVNGRGAMVVFLPFFSCRFFLKF